MEKCPTCGKSIQSDKQCKECKFDVKLREQADSLDLKPGDRVCIGPENLYGTVKNNLPNFIHAKPIGSETTESYSKGHHTFHIEPPPDTTCPDCGEILDILGGNIVWCPACHENGSEKEADKLKTILKQEMVDHPSHYNSGKFEVIDVLEDWNLGFCLGNTVKYIARADHKGKPIEDLEKALWYLKHEIEKRKKRK